MLSRASDALNRFSSRWVPDPFVLALLLTLLVFAVGAGRMVAGGQGTGSFALLGLAWVDGFSLSGGLAFALQMCFVLVTGHAMALSPPLQSLIARLASVPKSASAAAAMVALVACVSGIVHWGLGAIVGALLAREIGRHSNAGGLKVHYPILGAAAYSGMAVWHGGLSGSAPLKVAAGDGADYTGALSLSDLLFSPTNLVVTGSLLVCIPLLFWLLTPKSEEEFVAAALPTEAKDILPGPKTIGQEDCTPISRLQESVWPGRVLGGVGVVLMVIAVGVGPRKLDINTVNLLFFFCGLALQGSLKRYVDTVTEGAQAAGAIILQFPLYFGILGVLKVSGLITWLSDTLVSLANEASFPLLSYVSAGIVNLFVPSGGGQWGVQRDILLGAGAELQVDPTLTIMAFAYGDAWTNMLQPFWALPLLGIMGLKARDIIGYTAMVFLLMAVVVPIGLILTS